MKRILISVALVALAGCGPDKADIARSEANVLAEKWDGGPTFTPEGNDPWGTPYSAKVEKDPLYYHLTVRSNGPDKLPFSGDDIIATRSHKHTTVAEAIGPTVEKVGDALGKGLGRGGAAGIKEGITGKKPDDKKDDGENAKGRKEEVTVPPRVLEQLE
jgi:hypothetical protein